MDFEIPGIKPIWIISFNELDYKQKHIGKCDRLDKKCLSIVDSARECAAEAQKIKEELTNLQGVVDQFREFLKKFRKDEK